MRRTTPFFLFLFILTYTLSAQNRDALVVEGSILEATENSQLRKLGHQLLDGIGPRLVGTPKMKQANDWAVATYQSWGITARNEKWGEWRCWERGISHIDMVAPWVKTLEGTQLAWTHRQKEKQSPVKPSFYLMLPTQLLLPSGFLP